MGGMKNRAKGYKRSKDGKAQNARAHEVLHPVFYMDCPTCKQRKREATNGK